VTYTLTFLLGVLLARSGSTGRAATIRAGIAGQAKKHRRALNRAASKP